MEIFWTQRSRRMTPVRSILAQAPPRLSTTASTSRPVQSRQEERTVVGGHVGALELVEVFAQPAGEVGDGGGGGIGVDAAEVVAQAPGAQQRVGGAGELGDAVGEERQQLAA